MMKSGDVTSRDGKMVYFFAIYVQLKSFVFRNLFSGLVWFSFKFLSES